MCTWNDELVKVNTGKNLPTLFSFLPIRYGEWVYVFSLMSQCVKEREKKNYIKIYLLLCAAVRFAFVLRQRKNPGSYSPFSFATSFRCCCCCRCSILTHMHRNTQIQMEYCSRSSHNPPPPSIHLIIQLAQSCWLSFYIIFAFIYFLSFFSLFSRFSALRIFVIFVNVAALFSASLVPQPFYFFCLSPAKIRSLAFWQAYNQGDFISLTYLL